MPAKSSLQRLHQTLDHVQRANIPSIHGTFSIIHGPNEPNLIPLTLGQLLERQDAIFGDAEFLICPWTGARWSYTRLYQESGLLARSLISLGVRQGDRVGIVAGNCEEYVSVFFAVVRIGAILVTLNNHYTTSELTKAIEYTDCRMLFISPIIGKFSHVGSLDKLGSPLSPLPIKNVILIKTIDREHPSYEDLINRGLTLAPEILTERERTVLTHNVCNLQFTSGSTGDPKAAMLSHYNIINNSRFIGDRLRLTHNDTLCCPPPLFHCFGLVLGLLACLTHGTKIVLPSETFDPSAVNAALASERCTALHGVPAMFEAIIGLPRSVDFDPTRLRTGIIAGAPVPRYLMKKLVSELGMKEYTSSYGLTETSPTCFNAFTHDTLERRLTTVGRPLPHTHAKVVDRRGQIVPRGERGELCIAGYSLQKGYWNNEEKTNEVMVRDRGGIMWLHTGDEAVIDEDGYCSILGRFKDIIIRGGENIYPLEIEERLMKHPALAQAVVVGLPDPKYGETVTAFLRANEDSANNKPTDDEIKAWILGELGVHKAPTHIFWFGEGDVPVTAPQTGSGKIKKHELKALAKEVVGVTGQTSV